VAIHVEGAPAGPEGLYGLDEQTLRAVALHTLARVGITRAVELSILVTDDETVRRLNRDYRGRDEATDVLSFPLLEKPLVQAPADQLWGADERLDQVAGSDVVSYQEEHAGENDAGAEGEDDADEADETFVFVTPPDLPLHLGDVVIARDVTRRQAEQAGHSAAWELAYLLAHGVLHLAGYDDHTEAGYAAMVAHQEAVLRKMGIAR
jgi:probable rRNA maturation factor